MHNKYIAHFKEKGRKGMRLDVFLQANIIPIGIFFYIAIFTIFNRKYEPELTKKFFSIIISLFTIIIVDDIDYMFIEENITGFWHVFVTVTGYNAKIAVLVGYVSIALRDDRSKYKNIIYILAGISMLVIASAFFTDLVFYFEPGNGVMVRGPLAYLPHFMFASYCIIIVINAIYKLFHKNVEEGVIILTGVAFNSFAVMAETNYNYRGVLMGTIAIMAICYYLYLHTEYLKKDILTDTFNRMTYKADISKIDTLKSIVMIDLNDLKKLNDNIGHDEGDKALKTLAKKVKENIYNGCILYRIGGDEFAILCKKDINIEEMVEKIRNSMYDTPYRWSVGYSKVIDNDYDKTFKKADELMYEEKKRIKKESTKATL